MLSENPSWQTMVAEAVAGERSWGDLRKWGDFFRKTAAKVAEPSDKKQEPDDAPNWEKIRDWFSAAAEKVWDWKHHPATATFSAALIVSVTLIISPRVLPVKDVTVPVKPVTVRVNLDLTEADKQFAQEYASITGRIQKDLLTVQMHPTLADWPPKLNALDIPVNFKADPVPVVIKDVQFKDPKLLKVITDSMAPIQGALQTDLDSILVKIAATTKAVDDTKTAMNENATALNTRTENLEKRLKVVPRSVAEQTHVITFTIKDGSTRSVVLYLIDAGSGNAVASTVKVSATNIRTKNGSILVEGATAPRGGPCTMKASAGQVDCTIGSTPWKLTVNAIEKRLLYPATVTVSLAPVFETLVQQPASPPPQSKTVASK